MEVKHHWRTVLADLREVYRNAVPEDVDDSNIIGRGQSENSPSRPIGMRQR